MSDLQQRLEAQRERQQQRPPAPQKSSQTMSPAAGNATGGKRRSSAKWQRWMRWLHVYASMVAFAVILFFGITGILLNHPSWIYGDDLVTTNYEGALPESVQTDEGGVEFLAVSEYVREEYGIAGTVTNFDDVNGEGSINYTGPGYGATVRFDTSTLDYRITVREEGFVNAMRDLHTGSDTGGVWSLVIDISSIFLVLVAVTGLGIQVFMRKRRLKALTWLAAASLLTLLLIWLTMV